MVRLGGLFGLLVKVLELLEEWIRCFAILENRNVDDHFAASPCVDVQRECLETRMPVVDRLLRYEDGLDLAGAQVDRVLGIGEIFAAVSVRRRMEKS